MLSQWPHMQNHNEQNDLNLRQQRFLQEEVYYNLNIYANYQNQAQHHNDWPGVRPRKAEHPPNGCASHAGFLFVIRADAHEHRASMKAHDKPLSSKKSVIVDQTVQHL